MKKTSLIVLGIVFMSAITSCQNNENDWITGNKTRDTLINRRVFRSYGGHYYPVFQGLINPSRYNGSSLHEISSPSYHPSVRSSFGGIRSGGFGSSSHFSAAS